MATAGVHPSVGRVLTFHVRPSALQTQKPRTRGQDRETVAHALRAPHPVQPCSDSVARSRKLHVEFPSLLLSFFQLCHSRTAHARTVRHESQHTRLWPSSFQASSPLYASSPVVPTTSAGRETSVLFRCWRHGSPTRTSQEDWRGWESEHVGQVGGGSGRYTC